MKKTVAKRNSRFPSTKDVSTTAILAYSLSLAMAASAVENRYAMHIETPLVAPVHEDGTSWKGGNITIAFWNIEYWPGGMFEPRLEPPRVTSVANQMVAVKDIVDRENPTILIASEMHSLASAEFLNQNLAEPYPYLAATAYTLDNESEEIAFYENLEERHKPPRVHAGRRHDHAVFSRIPWSQMDEVEIDTDGDLQPRGFVVARFEAGIRPLWVYGVHSSALAQWAHYRAQKPALLVEDMRKRGLRPTEDWIVVAGDFNLDMYRSRAHRRHFEPLFRAGFLNTFDELDEAPITKPTGDGGSTIDYIFVSKALGAHSATVVADSAGQRPRERAGRDPGIASDHRMIKVTIVAESGG